MASVGGGIRISAAASATTLAADEMAVCTYTVSSIGDATSALAGEVVAGGYPSFSIAPPPVTRVFGPSQTIPSTFTSAIQYSTVSTDGSPVVVNSETTVTYSLQSGVILENG